MTGTSWKVLKQPPRGALTSSVEVSASPARLSRTILAGNTASRVVAFSKDSSIAYDPREHRFVNTNSAAQEASTRKDAETRMGNSQAGSAEKPRIEKAGMATATVARAAGVTKVPERAGVSSATVPRTPRNMTPPPPPRSSSFGGERGGSSSGSSRWSGPGRSSAPSAPASHPTAAPSGRPH